MRKLKIKEKFFVIQCVIMLMVCMVSLTAFHIIADGYERQIYTEAAEVLQLASITVDNELTRIEKLSFQISTDARIQEYLAFIKNNDANYESFKVKENLANRLMLFMQQENYISSLRMIDAQGQAVNTVLYSINEPNEDLITVAKQANGSNSWIYGEHDSQYLISVRQVKGMKNLNLSHYGVLAAWIDMEKLTRQHLDFSQNKLFLMAKDNRFVYANQPDLFAAEDFPFQNSRKGFNIHEINGIKYLISYQKSHTNDGLTYYNVLPYEVISQQTTRLRSIMTFLFIGLFIIVIIVNRIAASSITKPLMALTEMIKTVQRGSFDIPNTSQEFTNMDETGHLHRNFRIMLEKINELFRENYQKQLIIQETEYKALQAQINPHFLYNTLDTINWMAHMNNQTRIAEMVEALGQMLRSIISKKEPLITLEEELRIVKDYITIQKNRFDDRLDFHLNLAEDLNFCLIPKLTIQPVIENAIQHGLEMTMEVCRIEVNIRSAFELIEISISDNGPGMEPHVLEDLKAGVIHSQKTGIGLTNIDERMKLMFGEGYGITIQSELGLGTTVAFNLPIRMR
jgi:two-component system sensor histidine kinase YesM